MRITFALLALAALAFPATAGTPCYTTSTTDATEVVIAAPTPVVGAPLHHGSAVYWVEDLCQIQYRCSTSQWYYEETNGIPGLQRGDVVKSDVDACNGLVLADYKAAN